LNYNFVVCSYLLPRILNPLAILTYFDKLFNSPVEELTCWIDDLQFSNTISVFWKMYQINY
jgi:hypothetical protein